jgi:hypothetical protein
LNDARVTYSFNRNRFLFGCALFLLFIMLFGLAAMALFGPPDAVGLRVAMGVLALAFTFLLSPHVSEMTKPDPMLTIGPDGIYFQPLNDAPVPWSQVSAVKVIESKHGKYVVFDVHDPARANLKQGFQGQMIAMSRSMNDGYRIYNVMASADEIVAAMKVYWTGDMPVMEAYGFTYRRKQPPGRSQ